MKFQLRRTAVILLLTLVTSHLAVSVQPFVPSKNIASRKKLSRVDDRQPLSSLHALDPSLLAASSDLLSNENIKTAFSVATFLPQPFWFFMILSPNSKITTKVMGGLEVVTLLCLVHFFIVTASIAQPDGTAPMAEFSLVFDPAGDPQGGMMGMMRYPNFVTEEWSHVLTWDLFVGRWIWLDGLRRNIFTPHSVLLCNLIGPPGLLLHWATCIITGKGIVQNEALDENSD